MAAHRYWRVHIQATGGGSLVSIGELIMATTQSGAQAATGGTALASSVSSGNVAANAFDGTTSSANYWASNSVYSASNGAEWIQYDVGVGNSIDVVELRLYFNGTSIGSTTYPKNLSLWYSDDNIHWYLQRAWNELSFTNGETKTLNATALLSSQITNRVVFIRTYRNNQASNVGVPTFRRVIMRVVDMSVRHASAPARKTPLSGSYYVAGSTTVLGEPYARRVDLVEQKSGLIARSFHTNNNGQFLFEDIAQGPWTLVGVDNSAEQNSVIYAHVLAEPM